MFRSSSISFSCIAFSEGNTDTAVPPYPNRFGYSTFACGAMIPLLASSGLTESFLVGNKLLRYFSALLLLTAGPDRNFLINSSKSFRSDILKNFTTTDTPQFRNFSRVSWFLILLIILKAFLLFNSVWSEKQSSFNPVFFRKSL